MKQHELYFTILNSKQTFRTKILAMDIFQAQEIMKDRFIKNIDKYIQFMTEKEFENNLATKMQFDSIEDDNPLTDDPFIKDLMAKMEMG